MVTSATSFPSKCQEFLYYREVLALCCRGRQRRGKKKVFTNVSASHYPASNYAYGDVVPGAGGGRFVQVR